jgi:site-specific DNA-cytosine methylase
MVNGLPVVVDASRTARLRALGNAVVPACARYIGERILSWEEKSP